MKDLSYIFYWNRINYLLLTTTTYYLSKIVFLLFTKTEHSIVRKLTMPDFEKIFILKVGGDPHFKVFSKGFSKIFIKILSKCEIRSQQEMVK